MADSTATAKTAADMLAAQRDERLPFFFQHYDHDVATDEPGLLIGAAGIALALADRTGLPAEELWACPCVHTAPGAAHQCNRPIVCSPTLTTERPFWSARCVIGKFELGEGDSDDVTCMGDLYALAPAACCVSFAAMWRF